MITARAILFFTFILLTLTVYSQGKDARTFLGKAYAETQLNSVFSDKIEHNIIENKTLIVKDSLTALRVTEPMLFNIYDRDNITKQRPYETYLIDNHWIISGTLPKGSRVGTFLIIIDARDGRVLKITHGQ